MFSYRHCWKDWWNLSRAGASIDLKNPDSTFGVLLDGHSQTVTFGWLLNHGPKGDSSIERRASQRPFFKPVSLEPRLARLAVNLACGPLANGACLDPMTGTGGFTIEAIMSGRNAIGMDLDEEMIQGAKMNLEWAGSESNPFVLGDATNIKATLSMMLHPSLALFLIHHMAGILRGPWTITHFSNIR